MDEVMAVILAGGKGTRLHPYTLVLPKPLIPVGDNPVIALLLKQLRKHGVRKGIIALGYLGELIRATCDDGSQWGIELSYITEKEPLGTIGPLSLIRDQLPEVFVVTNGDVVSDINIRDMVEFHHQHGGVGTVACHRRRVSVNYGVIGIDGDHRVKSFTEKPTEDVVVNMGIYVFDRAVLEYIPDNRAFGVDSLIAALLADGRELHCYFHDGQWLDIGSIRELEQAHDVFEACRDRILGD